MKNKISINKLTKNFLRFVHVLIKAVASLKTKVNSKRLITNKFFTIVLLYILAIVIVSFLAVNERNKIHEENLKEALSQIETTKSGILSQMELLDTLYMNQVHSNMNTFMREGLKHGTPSLGPEIKFNGRQIPDLLLGSTSMAKNYELVDSLADDLGGTATLFVKSGTEFVRISTNAKKDDGSRIVGSVLTKGGKVEKQILAGSSYYGLLNMLGKPYLTGYEPIMDAQKNVIGIWYVGYPLNQIKSISDNIQGKKIFENDFYAITDDQKQIIAKSNEMDDMEIQLIVNSSSSSSEWTVSSSTFENWGYTITASVKNSDINKVATKKSFQFLINIGIIFSLFSLFIFYFLVSTNKTNKKIAVAASHLSESAEFVTSTSVSLNDSSFALSEGSSQQASAIEETSATMEQNSSMTKHNAENTIIAKNLSEQAKTFAIEGSGKMHDMLVSMDKMKKSSNDIAKIIKVIDDIAFQTNMLALNAAVEAARAGDAGRGFSVVAQEVRHLAQKSAKAANDTSDIIAQNISLSEHGSKMSEEVNLVLSEIMDKTDKVNKLIEEISVASHEQERGTTQIATAINQMEAVIQKTATTASESAADAKELMEQAHALQEVVGELNKLVGGK